MSTQETSHLRRDIGFFGAAFLVLNGLIGAGIFALPGKVAANAGQLSPWLFLVVGLFFLAVVLTFAELASYYDRTGGPVLYATEAFGPLAGFSTGWVIFLSRTASFARRVISSSRDSLASSETIWSRRVRPISAAKAA